MTKARWKQICLELSEDSRITLALPVIRNLSNLQRLQTEKDEYLSIHLYVNHL